MADTDNAIAEVYRKIEREKALINAASHMRQSTSNAAVQARVDSNIRDSVGGPTPPPKDSRWYGGGPERGDYAGPSPDGYGQGSAGTLAPRAPYGGPRPYNQPLHKARPNFSKLDLIKYDTPYLGPKIQLMLSQLEFKLSVEKQYKAGIEKMVRLYQDEGDRKSRSDAEGRRIESNQKVQLLKQALKKYTDLHVGDAEEADDNDDDSLNAPNMRKPLTGHLEMRIHAIKDVDHAASSRFSRGPETFVIMKVEDNIRAKTRATRTDRWTDEIFNVDIDKANEIELTVYDKSGDRPIPIGFLWIRISDIAEEMRRKKIETEFQQAGWVSADKMANGGGKSVPEFSPPPSAPFMPPGDAAGTGNTAGFAHAPQPAMIDAWFSLEPAGRIQLEMSFHKQTGGRRPLDLGLNRQGAVRQKKEEVVEKQGHKFVKQQFYNVMRCALCGDFLKYSAGMQCVDCKYTCHTKCYPKVVTKCISKANYETDPDEEKINHRIPHRFDHFSNIGANWCCHCGYVLPLGRKNAKKCSECGLTCHAGCQHLVPDFCGMSMIVANQILETINKTKNHNKSSSTSSGMSGRTLRPTSARPGPQSPTPSVTADGLPLSPQPGRQYNEEHYEQPKPSVVAVSAAQNMYNQPTGPPSPQHTRPPSGRTTSTQAIQAAAAAAAATSMRPASQNYDRPSADYSSQRPADRYANARPPQPEINPPQHATYDPRPGPRIGLDHFNFLAVLGKGNFGKVMLAEAKTSKKLYAIKVLKKEFIIENDEVESTKSEKRVFLIANRERHPFLLNLHACFQTETRVYFVMEYISGGDLMLHIQRGQFGLKRAQFYAAEVCLALKYFHENGVIYRDLKLDNILLTLDGHIKIADYGLCKEDMWYGSTTTTFCGTPEFMAPEILLDKKYGRAVDWWAFGVLIYQMLLQQSPFRGEDEDEIYDAILADEPLYPIHMPRDSVSILQKLLTREPELRLGSGPGDAQEIMSHAFFKGVNWDDVYHKRVPTPFKPTVKDAKDTSNFDQEFTSVTPVLTPVQSDIFQKIKALGYSSASFHIDRALVEDTMVANVDFIKEIPKVELHVHIEGTLTPQLRYKLAKKHQIPLKWATEEEAVADYLDSFDKRVRNEKESGSLAFFDLYYGGMDVLQTEEDFYELAMGYFKKAVEMKVRPEYALETYEAALKYRDQIHGIGLDSLENGRSPMLFDEVYRRAKADGFHLTAHCDVNAQGTHQNIRDCLTKLGGDGIRRIDHGLNAVEQPELLEMLKATGTGLTCCLWGAYGYLFHIEGEKALFRDMLRKIFDYGILVTINSDDPACMGMNYVQENLILVAEKCDFTDADIVQLQRNAVHISWAPESLKKSILNELQGLAEQPDFQARKVLAEEIGQAAKDVGFFYLVNPPVSADKMDAAFDALSKFFALPQDVKMKYHVNNSPAAKGFTPVNLADKRKGFGATRESFGMGNDYTNPEQHAIKVAPAGTVPLNQWPDEELPEFRQNVYSYFTEVYLFAKKLVQIFALALGLEETALDQFFETPFTDITINHYPPQPDEAEYKQVLYPHADYGAFTLLAQRKTWNSLG
ncbi:hypothetical protein DV737_g577, partial [Chaetothyriales sp. CBS 132003]